MARAEGRCDQPPLAPGLLAALPLFLAYELGLALSGPAARSPAEALLGSALVILGPHASGARLALLAGGAALAYAAARRRADPLGPVLVRQGLEGLAAGMALVPVLLLLSAWLGAPELALVREPGRSAGQLLRLCGVAPWEELFFRLAVYGLAFLAVRRALSFLGLARGLAEHAADLLALLSSAFSFALFHLESLLRWLGHPGESFHAGVFLWRFSAGILLAALFRWRGFGVAALAHAVFNLGVALGLGQLLAHR
jgi:hypothetical protein